MSSDSDYGRFPPPPMPPPAIAATAEALPAEPVRDSEAELVQFKWWKNAVLFVLTVISVFWVGAAVWGLGMKAWEFAVPLLAILIAHESGHYVAARIHRVPASLPYFIPLPILNPFGTLGAVILMPGRIRSRNALLDIGAAGPLAGMIVAIPVMLYGLSLSTIGPVSAHNYIQEGQCILYWGLKYAVFGHIPAGQDVYLHPTALAAWVGFLVTFLNMLPFGQLDGGHVAFALAGDRQNRVARWMLYVPLALVVYNFARYAWPAIARGFAHGFGTLGLDDYLPGISSVVNWLVLFGLLLWMKRASGSSHPPVDDNTLSPSRRIVAAATLMLFILLFMPSPWVSF